MLRMPAALMILSAILLAGCSSAPSRPPSERAAIGLQVLTAAQGKLGTPYRYGGTGPRGFDCSGLVQYAHGRAGIVAPRTTEQQLARARRVDRWQLRPGDLLFFRLDPPKVSHVGIYAGDGRFIHAPSSGKRVSYARLSNPYWNRRLAGAGRLY